MRCHLGWFGRGGGEGCEEEKVLMPLNERKPITIKSSISTRFKNQQQQHGWC